MVTTKRAVVFLISDFLANGYEKQMRVLSKRHDLIAVSISDPRELRLPPMGLVELEDAETGETVLVDAGSSRVRKQYELLGRQRSDDLRERFKSMGVDHIEVSTDRDHARDLVKFFRTRERRRR
jgi:uncharacterized protein (DUF58 family)